MDLVWAKKQILNAKHRQFCAIKLGAGEKVVKT